MELMGQLRVHFSARGRRIGTDWGLGGLGELNLPTDSLESTPFLCFCVFFFRVFFSSFGHRLLRLLHVSRLLHERLAMGRDPRTTFQAKKVPHSHTSPKQKNHGLDRECDE